MPKGVYVRKSKPTKYDTGTTHETVQGELRIVELLPREAGKQRRAIVMFTKTGYTANVQVSNIISNKVKDKRLPTVYGVGYLDTDIKIPVRGSGSIVRRLYDLWCNMLKRAYGGYDRGYSEVVVDKRWHSFKQFINTIHLIPNYSEWESDSSMHLDKDIKVSGNKIYSLDTCMFVSAFDNASDASCRRWHKK